MPYVKIIKCSFRQTDKVVSEAQETFDILPEQDVIHSGDNRFLYRLFMPVFCTVIVILHFDSVPVRVITYELVDMFTIYEHKKQGRLSDDSQFPNN